jgi:hypothetical protein
MERSILEMLELNEGQVPKTSISYKRPLIAFFKCVTARNIVDVSPSNSHKLSDINRWIDEKLRYYNLPYAIEAYGIPVTSTYGLKILFIGALDRQDDLVHVLHI